MLQNWVWGIFRAVGQSSGSSWFRTLSNSSLVHESGRCSGSGSGSRFVDVDVDVDDAFRASRKIFRVVSFVSLAMLMLRLRLLLLLLLFFL